MTRQFQFESEPDGKTITVEVKNLGEYGAFKDLVFLDHDIEYDIAFVAMGGRASTAYLLHLLWYKSDLYFDASFVCGKNTEFLIDAQGRTEWVRLNDVNARMILSLSMPANLRMPVILRGTDFTIERRIVMLDGAAQDDVVEFLTMYIGEDLLPERRSELESQLDAEHMGDLAFQKGYYEPRRHPEHFLRVLLASTDDKRAGAVLWFSHLMSYSEVIALLDAMTDEEHIVRVLRHNPHLTADDIMYYANRIQSSELRWTLGANIRTLSPEQRRHLMGEEP